MEFYAEQTKREEEEYGASQLQGAVERMSGVNWAKLMQEQQLKDQQQQQQMKPNVKLPPKTIPMRPAPPPPTSGLADMKLQDQPPPPRPTHKTNVITPALPVSFLFYFFMRV